MEDFTYHRPVLVSGSDRTARAARRALMVSMLPAAVAAIPKRFCGPGPMCSRSTRTPTRSQSRRERLTNFGGRVTLRQANFREAGRGPRRARHRRNRRRVARSRRLLAPVGKRRARFQRHAQRPARHADGPSAGSSRPRGGQLLCGRRADPTFPRVGRRAGCAPHCQPDRQAAQDNALSRNAAAGQSGRKNRLAGTAAAIRPPRSSKPCGWK